jgi:hypothetical protein
MPDFLETLDTIRTETAGGATRSKLLEGAGVSVRPRTQTPRQKLALLEATKLVERVYRGESYAKYLLEEAMTSSDFPLLFGQIIDRTLLAGYQEQPVSYESYCKVRTVKDFREVADYATDGGEGVLPEVGENGQYANSSLSETEYKFLVKVYGRKIALSFQMLINDDLDAFRDIPQRLGKAARRTEERLATQLFVGASGPHASLFSVGNGNILSGNPVLNVTSLGNAITHFMSQNDADGEPIEIEAMVLVVPPALYVTSRNLLQSSELRITVAGGDTNQQLVGPSWAQEVVKPVVNYQIPKVATSANANTSWFLFADPNRGRPALQVGRLRGYEKPGVFMKKADSVNVNGGGDDDVAFDNDGRNYKVRHIFGGGRVDPKMALGSNGSGA